MFGWSREPAATPLVTGSPLLPLRRVLPSRGSRARYLAALSGMVEAVRSQRTQKTSPSKPTLPPQRAPVNLHAAGIDVGAEAHCVAVPPRDAPQPVRSVGAYTADLDTLADWLLPCGITTGARESTGVSWIPLFALLEARGFEVFLVDPQPGQQRKGRPTSDGQDG